MNVIIVHGGPLTETPEKPHHLHELYWQPWVKTELEKHNVRCDIPVMPNPWLPRYSEWKETFEKYELSEQSILVGHSRGAAFLIRWLGETRRTAKKLILVAPNLRSESENPIVCEFYNYSITPSIKLQVTERLVFTSENDDLENMESAKILKEELNCDVINLPGHGHYITQDMETDEFPELVNCILSSKN